jgi:hypothetical protein
MPRRGEGQKVESAKGQTYGDRSEQEAAQSVVPISDGGPVAGLPAAVAPPGQRPGGQPFGRPSERPNEAVTAQGSFEQMPQADDPERRFKAAAMLPMIEAMASQRGASPHLRNSVRKLKLFIGDPSEFADRNP